jgi:glycosyltransferase involved in cell wall biosynthesis
MPSLSKKHNAEVLMKTSQLAKEYTGLVSVIIPAYGHAEYIVEAIESVLGQDYPNIEIIVVNDESPDDTVDTIAAYIESGAIRYLHQMNGGVASARNYGIAESKGEYLAFLDDDDRYAADKIGWQVAYLEGNLEVVGVAGRLSIIDNAGEVVEEGRGKVGFISMDDMWTGNPIWSPGQIMVRNQVIDEVGGYDESIWGADDWDWYFRLIEHGALYISEKVALYYRLHVGNASSNANRMLVNGRRVIEKNKALMSEKPSRENLGCSYISLFENAGKRVAGQCGLHIRSWALRRFLKDARELGVFVGPMLKYANFRSYLVRKLVRKLAL